MPMLSFWPRDTAIAESSDHVRDDCKHDDRRENDEDRAEGSFGTVMGRSRGDWLCNVGHFTLFSERTSQNPLMECVELPRFIGAEAARRKESEYGFLGPKFGRVMKESHMLSLET